MTTDLISFHNWSLNQSNTNNKRSNIPEINFHVIKYSDKCLYVWVGDANKKMENLSCSMQSPLDRDPLGVEIMQSHKFEQNNLFSNLSKDLAIKLAKKLNKQIFVSFNVGANLLEQIPARVEPITTLEESYMLMQRDSESSSSLMQMIEKALFQEIKSCPEKF